MSIQYTACGDAGKKRMWLQPLLRVLTKANNQERVLLGCKTGAIESSGPLTSNQTCEATVPFSCFVGCSVFDVS